MKSARAVLLASFLAVTLVACSTPSNPAGKTVSVTKTGTVPWIAVQDGTGAWTALTGNSFDVSDPGGRYGVAWACILDYPGGTTGNSTVVINQLTTADTTSVVAGCQTNATVNYYGYTGTVSNIPANGYALVSIGANQVKVTSASPSFSLQPVASGTRGGHRLRLRQRGPAHQHGGPELEHHR